MKNFLENVQQSCVEYGHGGLWKTQYDFRDNMVSVDTIACYPGRFLGKSECNEYFKRFGHPTNLMTKVAINGPLPDFDLTEFACVKSFEFASGLHLINYAWFGRHFHEKKRTPIPLLRFMLDKKILTSLTIGEAITCYTK